MIKRWRRGQREPCLPSERTRPFQLSDGATLAGRVIACWCFSVGPKMIPADTEGRPVLGEIKLVHGTIINSDCPTEKFTKRPAGMPPPPPISAGRDKKGPKQVLCEFFKHSDVLNNTYTNTPNSGQRLEQKPKLLHRPASLQRRRRR